MVPLLREAVVEGVNEFEGLVVSLWLVVGEVGVIVALMVACRKQLSYMLTDKLQ